MAQLSVFDLDHTLIKANSSYLFGAYLYRQNFFSSFSFLTCLVYYARHKLLGLSIKKLHEKVFLHLFKGRSLKEIQCHAEQFLAQNLEKLFYLPVVKRLREAQQRGDYTLILSSSPDFLVRPIAEALGVNEWKSTIYMPDDQGGLSYLLSILEGEGKADYVADLARQMSLGSSSITAYSDSYLDLPVLKMAGKAIGVVPDFYLKRICQQKGWEIL